MKQFAKAASIAHLVASIAISAALIYIAPYAVNLAPLLLQYGVPSEKLGQIIKYAQVALYVGSALIALSAVVIGALFMKLAKENEDLATRVDKELKK